MSNVARIVNIQGRCGNKNIVGPNHYTCRAIGSRPYTQSVGNLGFAANGNMSSELPAALMQ